jgi:LEA14-like dessication related protein
MLSPLALAGCTWPGLPGSASPEVSLVNIRPVQMGLLEQALELDLRFVNPNEQPVEVDGLRYELAVDGGRLGSGVSDARFTLPRLGEAMVPVRLYVQTTDLINRLAGLGSRERVSYRLTGQLFTASTLTGRLSFARDGTVDFPQAARSPPS